MIAPATDEEVLAVTRAVLEVERDFSKYRRAWGDNASCVLCEITNPVPLGRRRGEPLCYRCKGGRCSENHSLIGGHLPPRLPTDPNDHKVLDEVQRIMRVVISPGVGIWVAVNISAWVTLQLAGLGSLRAGA